MPKRKASLGALLGETTAAHRDHYQASPINNVITAERAARALMDVTNYVRALEQRAEFMESQYRKLQGWLSEYATVNATPGNAESEALRVALTEAREFVAMNLAEFLECSCLHDDEGNPRRDTLDEDDKPEAERVESILARIDAALSTPAREAAS